MSSKIKVNSIDNVCEFIHFNSEGVIGIVGPVNLLCKSHPYISYGPKGPSINYVVSNSAIVVFLIK